MDLGCIWDSSEVGPSEGRDEPLSGLGSCTDPGFKLTEGDPGTGGDFPFFFPRDLRFG